MKIASNTFRRNKVNVFRMGKLKRWNMAESSTLPDFVFLSSAVRSQVKKTVGVKKAVVIYGEPGSEIAEVAASLFLQGQETHSNYREFHPDSYTPVQLAEVLQRVNRQHCFTIFFYDFDAFSLEQQHNVVMQLKGLRAQGRAALPYVRLMFSLRHALTHSHYLGLPPGELGRLFECQQLEVPPLRERPQDVAELVTAACREFRQSSGQSLHPDVMQQLQQYEWPGNTRELRRSIARLLMLSDNVEIGLRQAHGILPAIVSLSDAERGDSQVLETHRSLCDAVLNCDRAALRQFHPSVSKALLYLGEHFRREMSLAELAGHSHISPSHLSYLLKQSLTLSFKQILNLTRIFYACRQLEYHPRSRITNLYLDCGYGDLSHFEKMFKRYTGLTPNEFRKKLKPAIQQEGT